MASAQSDTKPRNPHLYKPGTSGNPMGRPKRKPITDAIMAALDEPLRKGGKETVKQAVRRRLFGIIMHGEDKDSLKAIELTWAYLEGKPKETVELDFNRALEDIAARTGAPRAWLLARAQQVMSRHALEPGSAIDDVPFHGIEEEAPPANATRVMAVRL